MSRTYAASSTPMVGRSKGFRPRYARIVMRARWMFGISTVGSQLTRFGTIDSDWSRFYTNSTVLSIPASQGVLGRRNENVKRTHFSSLLGKNRRLKWCVSVRIERRASHCASRSTRFWAASPCLTSGQRVVTWLILPVVICLSQRLSHACLSTNFYTVKLRMAH